MAWETRERGSRYYRRSIRIGGQVRSEYLGCGPIAELAAEADQARREQREQEAALVREEAARAEALALPLLAFCEAVAQAATEALTAAGYHRPKRGAWRKRMAQTDAVPAMPKEELFQLLKRAQDGDEGALSQVRTVADQCPKIWERLGNMADLARGKLIDNAASNPLHREALERKTNEIRLALAGPNPCLLEMALAERAALCWLQSYFEDYQDAALREQGATVARLEAQEKRAERAQKRYLSAVKALAQVRRLKIPAIQVNVGAQQVNVANLNGGEGRP